MVARGHLDVKVAVPCDGGGKPIHDGALFHEKTGIVEDRAGDRIAWTGSLNETAAGWRRNWESISVYTSWGPEPERVNAEERSFARLWAGRSARVIVLDVPEAVRRDLMRFLPDDLPARLRGTGAGRADRPGGTAGSADPPDPSAFETPAPETPARPPPIDRRSLVWTFSREAPRLGAGGAQVGEATAAVTPWPHQVRAFERLYADWPPKLLIADEVGLGKTIQAGMLLPSSLARGESEADPRPRPQGGPRPVADRTSREVQPQLADTTTGGDSSGIPLPPSAEDTNGMSAGANGTASRPSSLRAISSAGTTAAPRCWRRRSPGTWWCSTRRITPAAAPPARRGKAGRTPCSR